jgi:hypothetical protein
VEAAVGVANYEGVFAVRLEHAEHISQLIAR